jgi:sortase A
MDRMMIFRWFERGLIVVGLGCLTWYSLAGVRTWQYQREQNGALELAIGARQPPPRAQKPSRLPGEAPDLSSAARPPLVLPARRDWKPAPPATDSDSALIGRLDIARVDVSGIVRTGDDDATLRSAIAHLPGTPRPGEPGNVAMAAHRDTFFRGLRNIEAGDIVRIVTAAGEYAYSVTDTLVVDPDAVWVLDATRTNTLTLITCYPFNYLGSAPRRFIVRARQVTTAPVGHTSFVSASASSRSPTGDIHLPPPPERRPAVSAKMTRATRAPAANASTAYRTRRTAGPRTLLARKPVAPVGPPALERSRATLRSRPAEEGEPPPKKPSSIKRGLGKIFGPFKRIFTKGST